MLNKKSGFTMVELLVVLVIIAILAAVATPLYIANTQRAKTSEAVAMAGLIRQAERDYRINNNTYFDITTDLVDDPLPPVTVVTLSSGAVTGSFGLAVDAGIPQYFSNAAYTVEAAGTGALPDTSGASDLFVNPPAQGFIIHVDGANSIQCTGSVSTNCAVKGTEVGASPTAAANAFELEMDDTGRIFVTYNAGTTWSSY